MKSEKVVLRKLNYLKIIGILLVVIGHCTSIYTGGWVFTSPVNSPIYALIASYVYTFHVPMLVFVSGAIQYSIFFYLGYEFFRNKDKLTLKLEKFKTKNILIIIPILTAISLILILVSKMRLSNIMLSKLFSLINIVVAIVCIIICYLIVYLINNRMKNITIKDKIDKLINVIGKYSFNIYLLHEPIIFIVLHFISSKYINPNVLVMLCLSISVSISILISIIYAKLKTVCNNREITFQQ